MSRLSTYSCARFRTTAFLPAAALALALAGPALAASDWPQFRGPDRTGVSSETGLADQWPAAGPPLVWGVDDLGEGYGTPAVVGDRVYVQGTEGSDSIIVALSTGDGERLWKHVLGPKLIQDKGNGPRSTPTVVGDTVYVLNGMGELASLQAATGGVNWQFNMLDRFGSSNIRWGVSESPLVEGDRLYVMPGGSKGAIAALDRSTGETLWRSTDLKDAMSYSSLIAADVGSVRAILGFTQKAGVAVRADNGELLFRYTTPANRTANAAAPVFAGDLAFFTSAYGTGGGALRVKAAGDGVTSEEAWFRTNLQNHHGGVVEKDGFVYGFFGPALACVELATGEIRWRARSVGKGSLSLADGKLYLLGERHSVAVARATPDGYEEGGRFRIDDLGLPAWAYPVVSGGRLYVRNQNQLRVYDVSASP